MSREITDPLATSERPVPALDEGRLARALEFSAGVHDAIARQWGMFGHTRDRQAEAWQYAADLRALAAALPALLRDRERIDALEAFVNTEGALGLRLGSLVRTLREALDQLPAPTVAQATEPSTETNDADD